jgi:hypothetical protein
VGDVPLAVRECPHCGEPTLPNRLADGAIVCSCPAARDLPRPGGAPGAVIPTSLPQAAPRPKEGD